MLSSTILELPSDRQYATRKLDIPGVENIEIKTDVGGLDAHGVLHSNALSGYIGDLIKGKYSNPPALSDDDDKGDPKG